ncbi:MAG: efflux RND transporter periplasmic adaptor subunit [Termitinemataceae bacterium]|nr:MAG: efflux RND transporter periplasmic adaptor subunit [Termitinemataceae bacterium]
MKKKSPVNKSIIVVTVIIALAAAVYFIITKKSGKNSEEVTYTVHSEVVRNIIEIAGNISAAREQTLQAAGDGSVVAVYVEEGDKVTQGQILLQLDDTEQRYNLARQDYDIDQKRLSGAPRELELMRKQRLVLLQRIKDRQITASFDGVVAQFTASADNYLLAKDSIGTILDRTYLKATVEVVETDAPKLKHGQKVTFMFPASGNVPIEGYVYSFPAIGTKTTRGAAVVNAELRIDDPPDVILPNYSFTGEIEISPPHTFLLVERQALAREEHVFRAEKILPDGGTERVTVEARPYGAGFFQIIKGLQEGDKLKQLEKNPVSGSKGVPQMEGGQRRNGRQQGVQVQPVIIGPPRR